MLSYLAVASRVPTRSLSQLSHKKRNWKYRDFKFNRLIDLLRTFVPYDILALIFDYEICSEGEWQFYRFLNNSTIYQRKTICIIRDMNVVQCIHTPYSQYVEIICAVIDSYHYMINKLYNENEYYYTIDNIRDTLGSGFQWLDRELQCIGLLGFQWMDNIHESSRISLRSELLDLIHKDLCIDLPPTLMDKIHYNILKIHLLKVRVNLFKNKNLKRKLNYPHMYLRTPVIFVKYRLIK